MGHRWERQHQQQFLYASAVALVSASARSSATACHGDGGVDGDGDSESVGNGVHYYESRRIKQLRDRRGDQVQESNNFSRPDNDVKGISICDLGPSMCDMFSSSPYKNGTETKGGKNGPSCIIS